MVSVRVSDIGVANPPSALSPAPTTTKTDVDWARFDPATQIDDADAQTPKRKWRAVRDRRVKLTLSLSGVNDGNGDAKRVPAMIGFTINAYLLLLDCD